MPRFYISRKACEEGRVLQFPDGKIKFIEEHGYYFALSNEVVMNGNYPCNTHGYKYSWQAENREDVIEFSFNNNVILPEKYLKNRNRNLMKYGVLKNHIIYYSAYGVREIRNKLAPKPISRTINKCIVSGKYFRGGGGIPYTFNGVTGVISPYINIQRCCISGTTCFIGYGAKMVGDYAIKEEYYDKILTCSDCGEEYVNLTYCKNMDGKPICPHCRNNYFVCRDCGDLHRIEDLSSSVEGVCNNCVEENYSLCDNCGSLVRSDTIEGGECSRCRRSSIQEYSHKFPSKSYGGERRFGVEIELECEDSANRESLARQMKKAIGKDIIIKSDGSLNNGFEVVTSPLLLEEVIPMCLNIAEEAGELGMWGDSYMEAPLKYYDDDDDDYSDSYEQTCGIHVHVSRDSFTKQTLAKMLLLFSECRYDVEKIARRDCDEWAHISSKSKSNFDERDFIDDERCSRYRAINITNKHTIEFRIFKGTINKKYIEAYILFVDAFIKACEKITLDEIDGTLTMAQVLGSYLEEEKYAVLKEYFIDRGLL